MVRAAPRTDLAPAARPRGRDARRLRERARPTVGPTATSWSGSRCTSPKPRGSPPKPRRSPLTAPVPPGIGERAARELDASILVTTSTTGAGDLRRLRVRVERPAGTVLDEELAAEDGQALAAAARGAPAPGDRRRPRPPGSPGTWAPVYGPPTEAEAVRYVHAHRACLELGHDALYPPADADPEIVSARRTIVKASLGALADFAQRGSGAFPALLYFGGLAGAHAHGSTLPLEFRLQTNAICMEATDPRDIPFRLSALALRLQGDQQIAERRTTNPGGVGGPNRGGVARSRRGGTVTSMPNDREPAPPGAQPSEPRCRRVAMSPSPTGPRRSARAGARAAIGSARSSPRSTTTRTAAPPDGVAGAAGGRDREPRLPAGPEPRPYRRPSHAEGVWITAADGSRYLDGAGGAIVVNVGHGVPEVIEAIERQLRAHAVRARHDVHDGGARGLRRRGRAAAADGRRPHSTR